MRFPPDFSPRRVSLHRASFGDSAPLSGRRRRVARDVAGRGLAFALRAFWVAALVPLAASQSSVASLQRTVDAWRAAPVGWKALRADRAERFADELDRAVAAHGDSEPTWRLALSTATLDRRERRGEGLRIAAAAGRDGLHVLLRGPRSSPVRSWALADVVVGVGGEEDRSGARRRASAFDVVERQTMLEFLLAVDAAGLRTALLTVARRADDPLRPDAFLLLARWAEAFGPDPAIDLFLVQQLGTRYELDVSPHPFTIVLERIDSTDAPLSERARETLGRRTETMLLSRDWRDPVRALRLLEGLPVEERVPILLDALSVWGRRADADSAIPGLTRVQNDIARDLRRLSGLRHGVEPRPWIDWWVRVRQGRAPMPGTAAFVEAQRRREAEPRSTASFFGLRPESDRVTFVIDFSGSMGNGWGTTGHSRYVEAVDQLMRFLHGAPPNTRFNVVLFSGAPVLSSPELVPASPENLALARESLLSRTPNGGTHLRPAIELALHLDDEGEHDPEELEVDTIVVLCDGETSEGPGWVDQVIGPILPRYPVVFHAVHLGLHDDGTLRRLADLSGGTFLRVGG